MEAREQAVRRTTITLLYFEQEVPALYAAIGTAYILVIVLCQMLGLRPAMHISRWCKLAIWSDARKLSLCTARGKRIIWCLPMGTVPLM